MKKRSEVLKAGRKILASSFYILTILGCDSGTNGGYQLSPSDIRDIERSRFSDVKIQIPSGEECIIDAFLMADYRGDRVMVNATAKRITLTSLKSTGLFSSEAYTENIPYDSILAYRRTGMMSMYQNSIYFVDSSRHSYLLSFDYEVDVGFSGVRLPSTYLLDHVTQYIHCAPLSGYHEKWLFNNLVRDLKDLEAMPIGFRVRDSRIPFGGYVGCVLNLLDKALVVSIRLEDKEYSAQVKAGEEISFGSSEFGRKLSEGDIFYIKTSVSTHVLLKAKVLKDGDCVCEVIYL